MKRFFDKVEKTKDCWNRILKLPYTLLRDISSGRVY